MERQVLLVRGQCRDYLMSVHVISKSPNLLAFGVPALACTRPGAAESGPGGLVYLFSIIPWDPDSRNRRTSFFLSNTLNNAFSVVLFSCICIQNYPYSNNAYCIRPARGRKAKIGYEPAIRIGCRYLVWIPKIQMGPVNYRCHAPQPTLLDRACCSGCRNEEDIDVSRLSSYCHA